MALNVPVAMAMSMLVAITVTPWMSYHLLRGLHGRAEAHAREGPGLFASGYRRVVGLFLDRRWARWALLGAILVGLALTGWIALSGAVPLKMLPYDNKSELQLVIDMPEGSTLEATDAAVARFERYLATVPEVRDYEAYIGTGSPIDFNGLVRRYALRTGSHLADVRVNLVGKERRAQQSHEIGLRLRRDLEAIAREAGARLKIVEAPPGPPVLATLVAEVHGSPAASYGDLVAAAREVERRLAEEEGVVDTDVMADEAHERLDYQLDKEKAALHGVDTVDVTRTLALALRGNAVATVHEPDERQPLPLVLRLAREERSGAEELGRLAVKGSAGALVPLAEIGRFDRRVDDLPIYHKDLDRTVFVVGEIAGRAPAEVVLGMQRDLAADPPGKGVTVDWSGEGEWKITVDVFRDLGLAFAGALVAIYVLLVVETRSLFMPLLVMVAIPLGAIGVFPGFWLLNALGGESVGGFGNPVWFTATGMIGMIALAGIVIRNAIILIDFVRRGLAAGLPLREAILESGIQRFRPILLTAATAMLGAWPITLDPIFSGLAWSLIFGILASTAFTLVVVPVAYYAVTRRAVP
jgi:multidrug efflux pump subunit AcrB